MKIPVATLLFALLASSSACACEATADEMRAFYSRWRQADESNAKTAIDTADSIFTGTIDKVELQKTNGYLKTAHVRVDRTLKGSPSDSQTFRFDLDLSTEARLDAIYVCGDIPDSSDPTVTETYPYLLYVRDGVLIRANPLPLGEAPLPAETEIKMVKSLVTGGRAR